MMLLVVAYLACAAIFLEACARAPVIERGAG